MNNLKEYLADRAFVRQTIIIALICSIAVGCAAVVEWVKQ
jgi:hypothetical protein